jgi:DNA-3-methyladenine glycosylase
MRTKYRLLNEFYDRETTVVARELLGKLLLRCLDDGEILAGLIVEVEAYLSCDDPASHSHRGQGRKNATMFAAPGTLYVYPIHAKYCLNVVTEPAGQGAAVLIRALQPLQGVQRMADLRGVTVPRSLVTGPARLCQALAVDRSLDGEDLVTSQRIWIATAPQVISHAGWQVQSSARIGISQATDLQLRWFIDGHQYVSGCARDHSQGRSWAFEDGGL